MGKEKKEKESRIKNVRAVRQYHINWSNIHVIGVPEERKLMPEVIFEEKMAKDFPKMIKDIKPHIK